MIHYHGTPITPASAAAEILLGRHAIVSFAHPAQVLLVADVCQSFIVDNGSYSFWRSKRAVDWFGYYAWIEGLRRLPAFDWALIPDVIDGTEEENDELLEAWPFGAPCGVPVWHLHETIARVERLAATWPRIAFGSSGDFARVGSAAWWQRMGEAMAVVCGADGEPQTKLHGLRMLDPRIFSRLPFASADSTNIARNINLDTRWKTGAYPPPTKAARGIVIASRIEAHQSAHKWTEIV